MNRQDQQLRGEMREAFTRGSFAKMSRLMLRACSEPPWGDEQGCDEPGRLHRCKLGAGHIGLPANVHPCRCGAMSIEDGEG